MRILAHWSKKFRIGYVLLEKRFALIIIVNVSTYVTFVSMFHYVWQRSVKEAFQRKKRFPLMLNTTWFGSVPL